MEFLVPETKVYAILTAGYDRKERMEGRILGEELGLEVCSALRKIREDMYLIIISGYAEFSYIIGKFDIRRTLDKKSPHKGGHGKQTID